MFKQLGWCVALLILAPAGAEAQQSSIQVSARVVSRVETQRVVAQSVGAAEQVATEAVPSSWRWEVRTGSAGGPVSAAWSGEPAGSGRGGEELSVATRVAMAGPAGSEVSYLFAPI